MRGFRQDSRHRQLIENIRDEHIDIVAVQETLRMYFSLQELEHLSSHMFAWHWLPSSGTTVHSSAILLGVKDATFDIGSMNRGEFYVSMEIFERAITFKWEIVVVYGPTDHSRSTTFLEELHHKISCATLPVVVGGDFNLIPCVQDKSNGWVNFPRMQLFRRTRRCLSWTRPGMGSQMPPCLPPVLNPYWFGSCSPPALLGER
ncbi:hypothetical protein ZWY2020_054617 [Hordeum vulgare]|nr:hypothetical protein ZWY2020_054617 [Hordeum vulgare]